LVLGRNQDVQHLEIMLDDSRRVVVENMELYQPLSKYIDAERLFELQNMKCS
jgi:hypothetical protein